MSAAIIGKLLRAPGEIAADCREDRDVRAIVLTSIVALALGAAVFGGVVGSFRGGVQIAYAAVKVPLALMGTLVICASAFHALLASFGRAWPIRTVISLSLAASARSSLVLLALAPALWLVIDWSGDYHFAVLAAAAAYGVAGLAALGVLLRALGKGPGRALTAASFLALFFAVGGQTSWILRPFIVRPRTEAVPFLRSTEGGFGDSIIKSSRSAAGIYEEETPPVRNEKLDLEEFERSVP